MSSQWPPPSNRAPDHPTGRLPWSTKRKVAVFAVTFVVLLVWLGSCSHPSGTGATPRGGTANLPTSHVFVPPVVASAEAGATIGQSAPSAPLPQQVGTSGIGDGLYEVGADLPAGKYKTPGPQLDTTYPNCYYEVSKTGSGTIGDIVQNNNTKGQAIVALKVGQFFQTKGCAAWQKQ